MTDTDGDGGTARYVFRVTYRLDPDAAGVSVDPTTFETTMYRAADQPGTDGWLFFRDNLWHGELGDADHFRTLTAEALGVTVTSVSFSELRTDEAYLDALRTEVGANLGEFNAASVDEALSKYLGSSVRVTDDGE